MSFAKRTADSRMASCRQNASQSFHVSAFPGSALSVSHMGGSNPANPGMGAAFSQIDCQGLSEQLNQDQTNSVVARRDSSLVNSGNLSEVFYALGHCGFFQVSKTAFR